ncbi:histidine kinase [Marinilabiliaceae bacterium JC017]|nr:histidine kinase [Marinilabiliaceae bacterium JC017]
MKKVSLLQNNWLRLLIPIPVGMVVYTLILLVFDSLNQLSENFFSREAMVTILFTYLLLEGQRLFLLFIEKHFPLQSKKLTTLTTESDTIPDLPNKKRRSYTGTILIQLFASLLFSIALISIVVSIYYRFYLGFIGYHTELIVFNAVFAIVSIVYNMIHSSTHFLAFHSQILYLKEMELRKSLEHDLERFKLQINPSLLYQSLENLIAIVHSDPKLAENYIDHLSRIYRYTLDARQNELVCVSQELKIVDSLLLLLNVKYQGALSFDYSLNTIVKNKQIVPGTLQLLIQQAIERNIISGMQPLIIKLENGAEDHINFSFNDNEKLTLNESSQINLNHINKAYAFFSNKTLTHTIKSNKVHIEIPVFEVEEE